MVQATETVVSGQDRGAVNVYVDPYLKDPVDWTKLPKGDLVLFSHGHFDHGVLMALKLYEAWHCKFAGPRVLMRWMARKYRKRIPNEALISIDHHDLIDSDAIGEPGDKWLLACDAGHGFIARLEALAGRNRAGKTVFRLPENAKVLPAAPPRLHPQSICLRPRSRLTAIADAYPSSRAAVATATSRRGPASQPRANAASIAGSATATGFTSHGASSR